MENTLRLTLVQIPLAWHDPKTNRKAVGDMIRSERGNTDLIILPEMFTTGFTMTPEAIAAKEGPDTLEWMRSEARNLDAAICGSIVFRQDGNFYNRLFFVTPEGDGISYDKRHTFTLAGEDKVYARGKSRELITYRGFRIFPLICYDLRFPVWSRNTQAYDLLLYVANWPAARVQAWDTLLRARAIENMAYCAGVNRVGNDANGHAYPGHSAVYDSLGNRLVFGEKAGLLRTSISKGTLMETREKLRFLDDRDSFSLVP